MRAAAVDLLRPRLLTGPRLRLLRWRALALAVALLLSTALLWGATAFRLRGLARELAVTGPAASPGRSLPSPPDMAALRARLEDLRSLGGARRWSALLPSLLTACASDGTSFSQVASRPDGVALTGTAPHLEAAARCADLVGRLAGVEAVAFRGAARNQSGGMTFELHLSLRRSERGG